MKRFSICLSIENIGFEGEIEGFIETKTFYIKEEYYTWFKLLVETLFERGKM